jgi:penicillin-binding protein 2
MRGVFLGAVLLGLVIGVIVAAARIVLRDDSAPPAAAASPSPAPSPTTGPAGSPEATAARFAAAWMAGDFNAMFLLLTPAAQRDYPLADFAAHYRNTATALTQTTLDVRVVDTSETLASLAVRLETAYFGTLEYTIALDLVQTSGGYAIAWDRTDIHPALANGRFFRSTIERPSRGAIYDRNGNALAITEDIRMLGLNRAIIDDAPALRAALLDFGFTAAQVDAAFNSPLGRDQRVPVGPVPDARAEEASLTLRRFSGVLFYFEERRTYPLGPAAAHVVGYTRELTAEELADPAHAGRRPGDRTGAIGIERAMDTVLAGQVGATLELVAADRVTVVEVLASRPLIPGKDIRTTLDAGVLRASYERLGDRAGAAVVLDPQTNAVLALNSSPAFDPAAFERGDAATIAGYLNDPRGPLNNRATVGLYSAGSTFKLITGAAGLVAGGYTPASTIFCGATWAGVQPPRRNWEGAQGPQTIAQGLMRSCNPVFYEIGLALYNQTDNGLSAMARAFGFGAPTGIVGIGEEEGLVPDAAWKRRVRGEPWFPGDDINLAIGQGDLLVTPLQLANAYSTFVARELRTPVLIAGETPTSRGALPLSDAQWAHLQLGLELVTGPNGTANTVFWNAGYRDFAGKSGTAEDANEQQHVLFVAYAPAKSPRALAAVILDDGQSGSTEAGPIARDIVLAALR